MTDNLPCPHGRETWRICPHCLGINSTNPDAIKIQEVRERHGAPQLEAMRRTELLDLLGKITAQCTHALETADDDIDICRAWLRTIRRTALQREDV